ncbi:hypothetical protein [Serinibacter salmoneus]|uniref:Uncharacterized protein n=1 Tax=Serinibacter salmoneus TaxID=556530 RepID=A0A2A9CVT4_9MICO|nr:hypothetical protein [Serinibacter salmoneus]PFG18523.1 hypothetical protein ATL40_0059 [Serinibacter salmoneus]
MARSKIQDLDEVKAWFDAELPYAEMIRRYRNSYGIETTATMWSNWRRKLGYPTRLDRQALLIPWAVSEEHRALAPIQALRGIAARRAGLDRDKARIALGAQWEHALDEAGLVIHYDPDTEQGFFLVPAREDIDLDVIREPNELRRTSRQYGIPWGSRANASAR